MKFKYLIHSKKLAQLVAFSFIFTAMAYGVYAKVARAPIAIPHIPNQPIVTWQNGGSVNSKMTLSQNKVLRGSDGEIYLKIDLEAQDDGKISLNKERAPTDFVVVLDRSGSMSGKNKMDFAHKAIESLLYQVGENDRFSLVTFDNRVETPVSLKSINSGNRNEIISLVKAVYPRGGTNLGAGLIKGMNLLKYSKKRVGAVQRLILLSDGMTNTGITSTTKLSHIAGGAVNSEFVISTIGVGLDFNESLMSSIADHGTGSYYFLENVAKLDQILADEFYGASQILAKKLELHLNLAEGIKVLDASGYPLKKNGSTVIVRAGHLYQKQNKSFFVTLKLPTNSVYSESLGTVTLNYDLQDKPYQVQLSKSDILVGCLPAAKKAEVTASIDKDTFSDAWTQNNFGTLMKVSGRMVGLGSYGEAKQAISGYRNKLQKAYKAAPSPAMKDQISKLDALEEEVDDASADGAGGADSKRLSKKYQFEGALKQRVENKK